MSTEPGPWAKCFPHSLSFNFQENPLKKAECIITPILQARKPRPGKWKHLPKCTGQEAADPDSRVSGCSNPHPVSPPTLLESRSPVDPRSSLWESPDLPLSSPLPEAGVLLGIWEQKGSCDRVEVFTGLQTLGKSPPSWKICFLHKAGIII